MDLSLSPETTKLLAELREWSLSELRPFAREADRTHSVPEGAVRALATCPVQTSPFGGRVEYPRRTDPSFVASESDGSYVLSYAVAEEMVYGDVLALVITKGNGIGGKVVNLMGNDEQIERWAGGMDRGEFHYSGFALTEPHCGSDAAALRTTAVRDGDHYVINGHKQFCTGGSISDFVVVFATVDPEQGSRGIRGFVVPKDTPGFNVVRANESKLGSRVFSTSELGLENLVVPAENMLGWPNPDAAGFVKAMETLNSTRGSVASMATGLAQAAVDEAASYLAKNRTAFSVARAARFNDELDRMNTALTTNRHLARRVAWRVDQGLPHASHASMAKAYAPQVAERVVARVLQLMGPDGYSEDCLVEKWHRDLKIQDIWEGTGNIQRIVISRSLGSGEYQPA
ncbi:acyl-CoA dehydrogenase family protein [Sciscionella marina]|uniref:acyl-CoA dehydrogenase family protein n=1 Tax=Sciscionella marina TaxID=508770 RepID=UPI0003655BD5|nr:acyl-CoA dehydrogenase family protein [Sciscionella marina]